MFNLRLCNAATIRYSLLKFGHKHLCGKDYKYFSPRCCKCNSFGCIAAIRCVNACHGPHSDSVYSGSEHRQFNSPRLVKREAGFPNPRRALIGSNQLWRVNDSPYYRELGLLVHNLIICTENTKFWKSGEPRFFRASPTLITCSCYTRCEEHILFIFEGGCVASPGSQVFQACTNQMTFWFSNFKGWTLSQPFRS